MSHSLFYSSMKWLARHHGNNLSFCKKYISESNVRGYLAIFLVGLCAYLVLPWLKIIFINDYAVLLAFAVFLVLLHFVMKKTGLVK